MDDDMAREVESLTRGAPLESRRREDREAEPPADGEPVPDEQVASVDLTDHDAIERRSDLARHLRPSAFPADALTLLTVARAEGAPDTMLALLGRAPEGRAYGNVAELWEALGGHTEHRAIPEETQEAEEAEEAEAADEPDESEGPVSKLRSIAAGALDLSASLLHETAERIRPVRVERDR